MLFVYLFEDILNHQPRKALRIELEEVLLSGGAGGGGGGSGLLGFCLGGRLLRRLLVLLLFCRVGRHVARLALGGERNESLALDSDAHTDEIVVVEALFDGAEEDLGGLIRPVARVQRRRLAVVALDKFRVEADALVGVLQRLADL